tara:strand:+ start:552 stop:809 length:258 start_codon:yes stop_codon:yes gene_type:complete
MGSPIYRLELYLYFPQFFPLLNVWGKNFPMISHDSYEVSFQRAKLYMAKIRKHSEKIRSQFQMLNREKNGEILLPCTIYGVQRGL